MSFEEENNHVAKKEQALNETIEENFEEMWSNFMDSTTDKCSACQHSEDPYNKFCGLVNDQPGSNNNKCPWNKQ